MGMSPLVVIDPGHGGSDAGAVGNGLQEKDITLGTALKLRDALERCGIRVVMTRTKDAPVLQNGTVGQDLSARAGIANRNNANLFISWHADSFSNPEVNGVAAWIYPSTRGTETETIARNIVDSVAAAAGQNNRGVFTADFAVLRETSMPAVLVESGFITNPREAARLAADDFQRIQAEAAAKAICQFFGLPYAAPAAPAPSPSDPSVPASPFPAEKLPEWARDAIYRVYRAGLMAGYDDGTFRPDQPLTRAEMAAILVRFYEFLKNGRTL